MKLYNHGDEGTKSSHGKVGNCPQGYVDKMTIQPYSSRNVCFGLEREYKSGNSTSYFGFLGATRFYFKY